MLTFGLAIIYLGNLLLQVVWLNYLTFILMILVIISSLLVVNGSSKVIGLILMTISIGIFLYYKAPFPVWQEAVEENLYLVVMFTLVPLLRIPIQFGGYFEALQSFFRRFVNTKRRFYLMVSFISAFVGVLVNLAVVPLVYEISKASDLSANKKLLSASISRGFATCTIWSPTMASIALIIQLSGAKWYLFFPFGILSGLISGMIGYMITMREEKQIKNEILNIENTMPEHINDRKVWELSFFGILLITTIAMISLLTGIHTITVVSVASLIFPLLWLLVIGRLPVFFREFKGDYYHKSLPGLKNEIILFVGAGLFATSITYSHLGDYVPLFLSMLVGDSVILFTIVVIATCLMLSALGVHPIVTVAVIGETIKASVYGVTPTYMAVILAISWAMGISISPSSATIISVAGLVGQSPIEIGPRWNGKYVLITSCVLTAFITICRMLGIL